MKGKKYNIIYGVIVFVVVLMGSFFSYWHVNKNFKKINIIFEKLEKELIQTSSKNLNDNASSIGKYHDVMAINYDPDLFLKPNLLRLDPYKMEYLPKLLGSNFVADGELNTSCVVRPNNLYPFNGFIAVQDLYDKCVGKLTVPHVGKNEERAPNFAICIEETVLPEGIEYRVHLRKDVYWHPLSPDLFSQKLKLDHHFLQSHIVTAHDFKFFYDAVMNPYVRGMRADILKTEYADIIDFRVIDDFTFIVRWKAHQLCDEQGELQKCSSCFSRASMLQMSPLPSFVYKYFSNGEKIIEDDKDIDTYQISSEWAHNFWTHWANNYIVSCGPMIFKGSTDEKISLERNNDFFDPYASLIKKENIFIKDNIESAFQAFKAGDLNICVEPVSQVDGVEEFMKSHEYAIQASEGKKIQTIISQDNKYMYIAWNCRSRFFENKQLRQAICMSIDKEIIIQQILNGAALSVTGPFSLNSSAYNPLVKDWVFNQEKAKEILDQEGWIDQKGNGFRYKKIDDKWEPFSFKLFYYAKSLFMKNICEYISLSLWKIGIDCQIFGLDMADLSQYWEEHNFDAMFMCSPSIFGLQNPRDAWYSSASHSQNNRENVVGFSNSQVNGLIDLLTCKNDPQQRRGIYHKLHQIIHEEAPYLFLFTRTIKTCYREPIKNIFVPYHNQKDIPGASSANLYQGALFFENLPKKAIPSNKNIILSRK
ncbi:Uncharacterized protein CLAVI_000622 [Candidatus Clavichlamydia salmonicola]|uniref:ABC transporter substrate-binding protein n=1 Tax=Candidatus Clavichlamydia salmonicola TaxID=469812 RepID=UPI001891639E|nr:ABC transporter substrate-binding protein [Candidatus Clavichlamydia salmonicola]MBF5050998.1 Uncharacterized protein [Candidatus Clavichlamydia salmonicola]